MLKLKRTLGTITLATLLTISLLMSVGCAGSDKKDVTETSDMNESGITITGNSETEESTPEKTIEETFAFLDDSDFQGTILIAKGGEIVFEKSYKYSNVESQTLNTNDTVYEIGSNTKQFTAVALMMLVEEGKINLDDTLDKYIPEYSHAGEVTIRQLLNMTSGIVDYLNDGMYLKDFLQYSNEEIFSDKELTDSMQKLLHQKIDFATVLSLVDTYELEFVPGSNWDYSNTGYCFLSEVIARVSGMSFEDYMMENVLTPAGLETASFDPAKNTSTGYIDVLDQLFEVPAVQVQGEGGLRMTANDFYAWTQVIINRELLSEESWNEILNGGEFGYGFGLGIEKGLWGHNGGTWGFGSLETVIVEPNIVIITTSNISGDGASESLVMDSVLEYYGLFQYFE
jgi:CubicO group peptidase (beta-lactamase class C family)